MLVFGEGGISSGHHAQANNYVIHSDKRVAKCLFGHSEILVPAERAVKELYYDMRFSTVHTAKVKLWLLNVRW